MAAHPLTKMRNLMVAADMDWHRAVPWGVRKYITYLWRRYQKPIYITENGYPAPGESNKPKEEA